MEDSVTDTPIAPTPPPKLTHGEILQEKIRQLGILSFNMDAADREHALKSSESRRQYDEILASIRTLAEANQAAGAS